MSIPDEAVEAVARWLYARDEEWGQPDWEDASSNPVWRSAQDDFRQEAREVLEAAAPHLMAQAFDEGKRACDMEWAQTEDLVTADEYRFVATNPYRSQT